MLKNRPDLTPERVNNISALMDKAIPDALVTGYEDLCSGLDLPDPNDRYVLAAAIRSKAEVIVTFNLKDFSAHVLAAYDIEPMHPDDFISDLWDLDQAAVLAVAQKQRRSLARPSMDGDGYLDMLMRQGLVQTSKVLRPYTVIVVEQV